MNTASPALLSALILSVEAGDSPAARGRRLAGRLQLLLHEIGAFSNELTQRAIPDNPTGSDSESVRVLAAFETFWAEKAPKTLASRCSPTCVSPFCRRVFEQRRAFWEAFHAFLTADLEEDEVSLRLEEDEVSLRKFGGEA